MLVSECYRGEKHDYIPLP